MSRGREVAVKYCTRTKRHEAVLQERLTRRADRTSIETGVAACGCVGEQPKQSESSER